MSSIDKQAVQAVADLKAGYTLGHADVAILNELARIALASLEAEAVGEVVLGEFDDCGCHPDARVECIAADGQAGWENFKDGTRLYTAPTVPVSAPYLLEQFAEFMAAESIKSGDYPDGWQCKASNAAHEYAQACRAAMLQGSGPVTTSNKLPYGWVACSERMPEAGRILALYGKRVGEVCTNYVDEGYIGGDREFYFFDWEGGPRIDDCDPYDKAIVTHWMYWELPSAPRG